MAAKYQDLLNGGDPIAATEYMKRRMVNVDLPHLMRDGDDSDDNDKQFLIALVLSWKFPKDSKARRLTFKGKMLESYHRLVFLRLVKLCDFVD